MKLLLAIATGINLFLASVAARAGGGPENVLLVVNVNSESSRTIANHYVNWRQLPGCNVLYVDWRGSLEYADGDKFRDGILVPALQTIDKRQLTSQIDYIVYSSDLPWGINMHSIFPKHEFRPDQDPIASINGATYLAQPFLIGDPHVVDFHINWYVPGDIGPNLLNCVQLADVSTRGFRNRYYWDTNGNKSDGSRPSRRYYLSTMLGVTSGRGNTVDEVLNYLRRSVAADGSKPRGTIYFMWNKDVRSTTRDACFTAVAEQINAAGGHAAVQKGRLPTGAKDVAGLVVGTSDFSLAKEGIEISPGAICEHLTSAGGVLTASDFQTPLSEFLRYGAAGASGTVTEPRAIQAKFPLASIQLHYFRGCSLAESFYQSVTGPYQLLIVGDPLCQPWAVIPKVGVQGIKPKDQVKGTVSLTPSGPPAISRFEFFLDGRLIASGLANSPFGFDTTKFADGYHELRVVGTRSDPIETQGRTIVPFLINNHDATVECKLVSPAHVGVQGKIKLTVRQPGATAITVRLNSRDIARVQAESGEFEIAAATLGRGPILLQAIGEGKTEAVSAPVSVFIE